MIHLVDIDDEAGCIDLEVAKEQQDYVCSSLTMLARAWLHRRFRPRVFNVYDGETAVGMGMYLDDPEKNAYDFCQLFIDRRYQGKGYGKAAVGLVLAAMKEEGKYPQGLHVLRRGQRGFPGALFPVRLCGGRPPLGRNLYGADALTPGTADFAQMDVFAVLRNPR